MKYNYTVLMKHEADGSETVCVPAIDFCITSGDNPTDAIARIIDAASGCLVVIENEGWPVPPDTNKVPDVLGKVDLATTITCDTDFYRAINAECA